jgi:hypothetical protein
MPKHDQSQLPAPTPEQAAEYEQLAHRVQSAVAFFEGRRDAFGERYAEVEPKFLRVGVNSAMVETTAIARLLFRKGVFTAAEYWETMLECWREEVDRYQQRVKAIDGRLNI